MNSTLHFLPDTNVTTKPKRDKTVEGGRENKSDISLKVPALPSKRSDIDNETPVMTENIKERNFLLAKLEKKKTVLHYVGQVITKLSTKFHFCYLEICFSEYQRCRNSCHI